MVRLSKNQQKREIISVDVKQMKQSTLDDLSFQFNINRHKEPIKPTKEILINSVFETTKEDELAFKVDFTLFPSKASFSKVNLDLYFQEYVLNSTTISIPQSNLLNDNFEFLLILDMTGIGAEEYLFRVEMYEPWSSGENLNFTSKEIAVQYVPQTREERLVKIPTVKSVAGIDLTVVSPAAKNIFEDIGQNQKQEAISKRDEW